MPKKMKCTCGRTDDLEDHILNMSRLGNWHQLVESN